MINNSKSEPSLNPSLAEENLLTNNNADNNQIGKSMSLLSRNMASYDMARELVRMNDEMRKNKASQHK